MCFQIVAVLAPKWSLVVAPVLQKLCLRSRWTLVFAVLAGRFDLMDHVDPMVDHVGRLFGSIGHLRVDLVGLVVKLLPLLAAALRVDAALLEQSLLKGFWSVVSLVLVSVGLACHQTCRTTVVSGC